MDTHIPLGRYACLGRIGLYIPRLYTPILLGHRVQAYVSLSLGYERLSLIRADLGLF